MIPRNDDRTRLNAMDALHRHLCRSLVLEGIPTWLRASSRYLGGATPIELPRGGLIERVQAALVALDSGFFV